MINDLWYKNAVLYSLNVGTFMDSNGDGVGDFPGLMRRLDYLHGLGVTAVWLAPFQKSPCRDDGYDISDYYSVDERYGTLGDFVEFTHAAKQRGMRVLIDLVVNHTSDEHPWFKQACADPNSMYRDWYVWSKTKPKNADTGMVFPGVQKSTWTRSKEAGAYYFHRFYDFQPDLNTQNPQVVAEILKIMGFWIELGVSGFRMDAVPFVIAEKGADVTKPKERFDLLRTFREFLQWRKGDCIVLAEANVLPEVNFDYFGRDGDRMHMMFNFQVNQSSFYALAAADAGPLKTALLATKARPATAQWGQFLRNHDELDLGRLSNDEQAEVFAAFGPEKYMQLYDRGIRRRLAPMLDGDRERLELAYCLMFSLPGTPVLRYGDEIAMGDDLSLPERNGARTPMQWSTEPQGGFTKSDTPLLPVISEGPYGYAHVNVAEQRRDPNSFLNWMERMIRMRMEMPEIGWGDFTILDTGNPAVLALRYDWRNNSVLTVLNLSRSPLEVEVDVQHGAEGSRLVDVLADSHSDADARGRHCIYLEGYGYRWYRVGGLDYLLKRSDIGIPERDWARAPQETNDGAAAKLGAGRTAKPAAAKPEAAKPAATKSRDTKSPNTKPPAAKASKSDALPGAPASRAPSRGAPAQAKAARQAAATAGAKAKPEKKGAEKKAAAKTEATQKSPGKAPAGKAKRSGGATKARARRPNPRPRG
ncbi:MAG: trehalose synthase [Rhizobiales bacterium 24-66-13]|jgi:maltose alpha-D-glucosyltransferase/alpha-amylase|nr:MAG: trehalose synthase [Azorhizobium sp. 12-66-6]OYZ79275.1 MAG: trehalose synthase [Rhizobiales bacterium 24-66-13]